MSAILFQTRRVTHMVLCLSRRITHLEMFWIRPTTNCATQAAQALIQESLDNKYMVFRSHQIHLLKHPPSHSFWVACAVDVVELPVELPSVFSCFVSDSESTFPLSLPAVWQDLCGC